jgi:hypothetical protein
MAQQRPTIHFEDVPMDEARPMGRGPRMDPGLYQAFKAKIQSLDGTAARLTIPDGTSPATLQLLNVWPMQRLLGHDRLTTTKIYLNLSPEDIVREFREKW